MGGASISQEDKAKISNRIDRFGKQGMSEGNMKVRKKLSMDELLKSVVSEWVGVHRLIVHTVDPRVIIQKPPTECLRFALTLVRVTTTFTC